MKPSAGALREIAVGVQDLALRARFYREAFGLTVVGQGQVDAATAAALWGIGRALPALTLGRPDVADGPRLRLLGVEASAAPRPGADLLALGPLGIGFTTRGVERVHARVAAEGVRFVSPPLRLTPTGALRDGGTGPVRYEAFGQAADGEFVVLIERIDAPSPYGSISARHCTSEPLHSSHVVLDLEACRRFMVEALQHESVIRDRGEGPLFEELMGTPPGTRFSFEMLRRPGAPSGRIVFIQFDGRGGAAPDAAPPARGIHALRYDSDDLVAAAARVERAGGTLVRGPVEVDSPVLGRGRVIVVTPPFGTLLEIWQAAP